MSASPSKRPSDLFAVLDERSAVVFIHPADLPGLHVPDVAPLVAGKLFAAGLETYPGLDAPTREAIERANALALSPRLGAAPAPAPRSPFDTVRHTANR